MTCRELKAVCDRGMSAGDDLGKLRQGSGMPGHAFVHRPQITGAGRDHLFETVLQYGLEERVGERWCQFGTRLPVAALAPVEPHRRGSRARSRRIAIHQDGEFVVGQPDLWHAGYSRSSMTMFTSNSDFLFKISHSNDKKRF